LNSTVVRDIFYQDGKLLVQVVSGKGGLARKVPVLPGREAEVLAVSAGRNPDEAAFSRIPKHMDVHSYRREYAQALNLYYAPGRSLPSATGRLKRSDYNRESAERVSHALGHRRLDVVLRHYLRTLREASRPLYEQDRNLKVEMRKPIQERVRKVRKQLEQQRQTAKGPEAEQLAVLADYALGIQTAINLEGKQPFDYAGIAVYDGLTALQKSLEEIEKKGQR
jgi:hypothetical protein